MCDHHDNNGTLITGLALGAAIGAGLTFLFGTDKGKEIRNRVRDQYPEFFDRLDDVLGNIEEGYEDVVGEVKKVEKEVAEMKTDAKENVQEKVADLGRAVEKLGQQLEKAPHSKPHLFKGVKRH